MELGVRWGRQGELRQEARGWGYTGCSTGGQGIWRGERAGAKAYMWPQYKPDPKCRHRPSPHAHEPLPLLPMPLHSAPWPPAVPTPFPRKTMGQGPGLCCLSLPHRRHLLSSYCMNVAQALPPIPENRGRV